MHFFFKKGHKCVYPIRAKRSKLVFISLTNLDFFVNNKNFSRNRRIAGAAGLDYRIKRLDFSQDENCVTGLKMMIDEVR